MKNPLHSSCEPVCIGLNRTFSTIIRWGRGLAVACSVTLISLSPDHLTPQLIAQDDDPFADFGLADDNFDSPPQPDRPAPSTSETAGRSIDDDHPVVQSLRANPPKDTLGVARAVLYMTRIEKWNEVEFYVNQLAQVEIDGTIARAMVGTTGAALWNKLASPDTPIRSEARDLASKVIEQASSSLRSQATLEQSMNGLQLSSPVERKRAMLAILAARSEGLSNLISYIHNHREFAAAESAELLKNFAQEGGHALRAAFMTEDRLGLERLVAVASRVADPNMQLEMSGARHFLRDSGASRQAVADYFQTFGATAPSESETLTKLKARLDDLVREYLTAQSDPVQTVTFSRWQWSPEAKKVSEQITRQPDVALEWAYQIATWILRTGDPGPVQGDANESTDPNQLEFTTSVAAATVLLEREYFQTRQVTLGEPEAARIGRLVGGWSGSSDFWIGCWKEAKRTGLHGAQLRSIQLLARQLKDRPDNPTPIIQTLAEAAKLGPLAVRIEATLGVRRAIPGEGVIPGYPVFDAVEREIQQLRPKARALVIGGASELRDITSSQLLGLGIDSETAAGSREALQVLQQSFPFEAILIVDRVREMAPSELIQRIRSYPRTASTPIFVLTNVPEHTRALVSGPLEPRNVVYSSLTTDPEWTGQVIEDAIIQLRNIHIEAIDRILWKESL